MSDASTCSWCGRKLGPSEGRLLPRWFVVLAEAAAAFFHGGLWAHYELRGKFCPRCRSRLVPLGTALAFGVLALAACGIAVWLSIIARIRAGR